MAIAKETYQGKSDLYLALKLKNCGNHVTVAWLGKSVDPKDVLKDVEAVFQNLFDCGNSVFEILLFKYTHFGPNSDIPVYLCEVTDPERKKILLDLWKKYNVEQEHTKGLDKPNLHVKSQGLPQYADVGKSFEIDGIYVEEVGKNGRVLWCKQI